MSHEETNLRAAARSMSDRLAGFRDELRWNERFADIIRLEDGKRVIDYARFHDTEPVKPDHRV